MNWRLESGHLKASKLQMVQAEDGRFSSFVSFITVRSRVANFVDDTSMLFTHSFRLAFTTT